MRPRKELTVLKSEREADELVALLKRTMPFQVVADDLLRAIATIARRAAYVAGEVLYRVGDRAEDLFVVVSGEIQHVLAPDTHATQLVKIVRKGDVFGWAAVLRRGRLASATSLGDSEVIRINGAQLLELFRAHPGASDVVMSRVATLITREFTVPADIAGLDKLPGLLETEKPEEAMVLGGAALTMFRISQWLKSPRPYLMLIGFALFLGFWYLSIEVWKLPRFRDMPGLTTVVKEWVSKDPVYGLSIYTPEYYQHIWVSVRRVGIAFLLSTALGVPLGLFLGWSDTFPGFR